MNAYRGPSILCSKRGDIHRQHSFIVSGKIKSSFGKSWYYIQFLGDTSVWAWVPAKYVVLGEKYTPPQTVSSSAIVEAETESDEEIEGESPPEELTPTAINSRDIEKTLIYPTIDLNVRGCPDTTCEAVNSVKKNTQLFATKISENGWYHIELPNHDFGWVSGKYVEERPLGPQISEDKVSEEAATVENVSIEVAVSAVESQPPDPCFNFKENDYYVETEVLAEKMLLRARKNMFVRSGLNVECGKVKQIRIGSAILHFAKADKINQYLYLEDGRLQVGYLDVGVNPTSYALVEIIEKDFSVLGSIAILKSREALWKTYGYKFKRMVSHIRAYFRSHLFHFMCTLSFLGGVLMLLFRPTRLIMLNIDQWLLRGFYFAIRSRSFWKFVRKLFFIFVLVGGAIGLSTIHALWLYNLADTRQQIMGITSVLLITFSLGWMGLRVIAFFAGVFLLLLSYIEFVIDGAYLFTAFVLPSLILLFVYYYRYHNKEPYREAETKPYFDNEEIERIHQRMFRLRNFYPETLIAWANKDRLKTQWDKAINVVRVKTAYFDGFFNSIFKSKGVAQ